MFDGAKLEELEGGRLVEGDLVCTGEDRAIWVGIEDVEESARFCRLLTAFMEPFTSIRRRSKQSC